MMFTKENQTLYPAAWEYNATLILNELAHIVENNGGRVDYKRYNHGFIVNRSITEVIRKAKEEVERIADFLENEKADTEKAAAYREKKAREIADLEKIKNDPVEINVAGYITFVLDDIYYYIEIDDNPFFDHTYCKTPVENGKRSMDAYHEKLKTNFFWDCFVTVTGKRATKEDIKEAANLIFNEVVAAELSEKCIETRKIRVNNYFDNGYHYENVKEKERFAVIDF